MKNNYLTPDLIAIEIVMKSICASTNTVDSVIIDEEETWN